MRILGVDPGVNNFGLAIIDCLENKGRNICNDFSIIELTELKLPPLSNSISCIKRAEKINQSILDICNSYSPDFASVEYGLLNSNPKISLSLAFSRGVIALSFAKIHIDFEEYYPKTVKKIVTGNGNADKMQMAKVLKNYFKNFEFTSYHLMDAVCVALCHHFSSLSKKICS